MSYALPGSPAASPAAPACHRSSPSHSRFPPAPAPAAAATTAAASQAAGRTHPHVTAQHALHVHLSRGAAVLCSTLRLLAQVQHKLVGILNRHAPALSKVGLHRVGRVAQQRHAACSERGGGGGGRGAGCDTKLGAAAAVQCSPSHRKSLAIASRILILPQEPGRDSQQARCLPASPSVQLKMGARSKMSRRRISDSGVALSRSVTAGRRQDGE